MDRHATLRNGLVGAWCPSLECGGLLLRDRARTGHATITAATWQGLPGGVALGFNGTGSVVTSSTAQIAVNGATQATLSAWMYRASTATTVGFGYSGSDTFGSSGAAKRFSAIWFSDGNVYVNCEVGLQAYGYAALSGTGWNHVAFSFLGDGSTNADRLKVFVNGRNVTATFSGTITSALSAALGDFTLGKDSSNRFCGGSLDDVRVYNRTLAASEIRLLANQRGIGLLPTRHRRGSLLSQFWTRISGEWKRATPWINVGGTWKKGTPKLRTGGAWKG